MKPHKSPWTSIDGTSLAPSTQGEKEPGLDPLVSFSPSPIQQGRVFAPGEAEGVKAAYAEHEEFTEVAFLEGFPALDLAAALFQKLHAEKYPLSVKAEMTGRG